MQLEVIGVGGAGCRIADAIRAWDADTAAQSFVNEAFAFDTDTDSLTELTAIPDAHRHRYGESVARGLNGNLHRGLEVGGEHVDELSRHLDEGQPAVADGFLVVVGLGGATGGGTAPALVANLQRLYDEPVYVLATLPADRELEAGDEDRFVELEFADEDPDSSAEIGAGGDRERGGDESGRSNEPSDRETRPLADENAVRTLERLDGLADAIVCFDNEEWLKTGESLLAGRERLNREFANRVGTFFAATADTADAADGRASGAAPGAETIVDANDVGRILGSTSGIVTIGYGEQRVDADGGDGGVLGLGFGPDLGPDVFASESSVDTGAAYSAVETAIQKGLHGKATLECDRTNAERAMVIVGGPPEWLNRQAIADGRRTVESATDSADILGGDAPRPDGDAVFAVAVFADVDPVDRLEDLRATARETESRE